jgi:hypothetical protein
MVVETKLAAKPVGRWETRCLQWSSFTKLGVVDVDVDININNIGGF